MSSVRIATFRKVNFEQFYKDYEETFRYGQNVLKIKEIYDNIILPKRVTTGSAGYDFKSPIDFALRSGETIKIPTGIRCKIDEGWVLQLYPRSSLGFKCRLQLDNTVGIIDSDYYYSDNEGHIFIKISNSSIKGKTLAVKKGDGFAQGIFLQYGITSDDIVSNIRNGGVGSTGK